MIFQHWNLRFLVIHGRAPACKCCTSIDNTNVLSFCFSANVIAVIRIKEAQFLFVNTIHSRFLSLDEVRFLFLFQFFNSRPNVR